MDIPSLIKKEIGILGFGVNNRDLVFYLLKLGAKITVRERNQVVYDKFKEEYPDFVDKLTWEIQPDILQNLEKFEVVFRSPVIPVLAKELRRAEKNNGLIVTSQTKLFMDVCPCKVIGVTGTKGKGTTATFIYEFLTKGYKKGKTYIAGNIGKDPFAFLDELKPEDIVILELSSFQLEDLTVSPHIAVLLNVTPDHLDRHSSLGEYQAAKLHILAHQEKEDYAVVYSDAVDIERMASYSLGQLFRYKIRQPRRNSAWVANVDGDEVIFVQIGDQIESFSIAKRKVIGEHNLENIVPAVIVGSIMGVKPKIMQEVIEEFPGLPHRLSFVGQFDGVDYYNDSMATNPESASAALMAFPGRTIHLIAGGKDKGVDYTDYARLIVENCKSVSFLPGDSVPMLKKALKVAIKEGSKRGVVDLLQLDKAVEPFFSTILSGIQPHLKSGEVVLLAPAAASATPFKNYKERGEAYLSAIQERYEKSV